jgi:hypothetical protein
MRPRAVKAGEVACPEKVLDPDFGHTPEAAFFLNFEREKEMLPDKLARRGRERKTSGLNTRVSGPPK